MKVLNLVVESVKRIKNVVITPKGWAVKIAGKNQQGKTSILDALMFVLEGEKNIPDTALRAGEKKGVIDADFGGIRITRKFTEKGSNLLVTGKDGKVQNGQTFINSMLGNNATDVMSFMSKSPEKQREILVKLTGADTAAIDKEIEAVYNERTKIGHEVERLQAVLRSSKYDSEKGDKEIPLKDLHEKLDGILEHNQKFKTAQRTKQTLVEDIENLTRQIEKIKASIIEKQDELSAVEMELVGEELQDKATIFAEIKTIEADNAVRRDNKKYVETREALRAQEKLQEEKTERIEKLRVDKSAAIAAAKFPIPGLSFGDGCVLFDGVPLQEASGAEQIMVGIAILSKIIPADGIRILRCINGSLIDDENMRKIEELAEREQVQVWIEIVMNSPSDGNGTEIYIEDGQVKK
jgi:predicted ATP-dependent endonuclease of OLD family